MTCREKLKQEHPEKIGPDAFCGCLGCPNEYGYLPKPDYCGKTHGWKTIGALCTECWDREIPEEDSIEGKFTIATPIDDAIAKANEAFDEYVKDIENFSKTVTSQILDSGNRRQFETGAVRDIQEGKGRCDLMPLDVVKDYYNIYSGENTYQSAVFWHLKMFVRTGETRYLLESIRHSGIFPNAETMLLEVAKHFEEGAKKYGEHNWQKGIPVHCYIDSAVRHYLKFLRGDKDEPHDRAFCWNILCAIWTCKHKPELNGYSGKEREDVSVT